ncbi:anti sigma factor C-terminal domain-containing protein [Lysinibacillus agricola]|uniref:anti sigma factor C-terminal domain-containing protein n=1 Tax=Lysinibacillus agricola TaxID=2590012 RepID=UPI003C20CD68
MSSGTRQKSRLQDEYKRLEKEIGGADGLSVDLVIYGAVVTGNKKTLTSLQDLDFIKASSIGVITDKY